MLSLAVVAVVLVVVTVDAAAAVGVVVTADAADLPRLYDGDYERLLLGCPERVSQKMAACVASSSLRVEPSQYYDSMVTRKDGGPTTRNAHVDAVTAGRR
jgi:hypothetical protein